MEVIESIAPNRLIPTLVDHDVFKEWNHKKNIGLDPADITYGASRKVWWICKEQHEWQAYVSDRIRRSTKCPYCANKIASVTNNLTIKYPELLKEWDYSKNTKLPAEYLPKSDKKVWWLCKEQHEWLGRIADRTSKQSGCPYCSGRIASATNNLLYCYPEIAAQWHPTKNGELTPDQVTPYSGKKAWWKCSKEHEWQISVCEKIAYLNSCPYCANTVIHGTYNLQTEFPDLLKEWHPTKNSDLAPSKLGPYSGIIVWWKCSKEHEWQMGVAERTRGKQNCPYCSGKRPSKEHNLLIKFPDIAAQWHPTKNGELTPDQVTPYSGKKAWWACFKDNNHEWNTRIQDRTTDNTACPYCCFTHTNLEKFVEEKLGIQKFNSCVLLKSDIQYRPDFQLTDTLYLNVDGLYWHSDTQKDFDYHFKMRTAYEAENKRIIQFYEDEVYSKWPIVESMINNARGLIITKLNARDGQIKDIEPSLAQVFYNNNHLMGYYPAAKHYGLYINNELIASISIRQFDTYIEIARFCTKINTNVRGGFQRLLSYVINLYNPQQVISYCDLRYATGTSYIKAGFILKNISQGWYWTDFLNRFNRNQCKASAELTEKERAVIKGLHKIYDAGQAKYILILNSKEV